MNVLKYLELSKRTFEKSYIELNMNMILILNIPGCLRWLWGSNDDLLTPTLLNAFDVYPKNKVNSLIKYDNNSFMYIYI